MTAATFLERDILQLHSNEQRLYIWHSDTLTTFYKTNATPKRLVERKIYYNNNNYY